jgi:nitrogen fixation-related uncharacterized protein
LLIFRTFLAVALAVGAVCVYFFLWGLADGSVSSFNGGLWAILLAGVTAVPAGGCLLHANGHHRTALALLAVLAVPGLLAGLFLLLLIVLQPRWN